MIQKSNEQGESRHSNLDVPLLTFEDVEQPMASYVMVLSEKYWKAMIAGATEPEVVVLVSKMCQMLLGHVSMLVLKTVAPQVEAHPHTHVGEVTEGTAAGTSNLSNSEPLMGGCSYCRVTEFDIEACFGDILDDCFGRILAIGQRRSCDSVRLRTLLSIEVAKRVNSVLSYTTGAASVQSDEFTSLSVTIEMVYNVLNILKTCTESLTAELFKENMYIYDQMLGLPDFEDDSDLQQDSIENSTETWTPQDEFEGNVGSRSKSPGPQINYVKNGDQQSGETSETSESAESLGFTIICPIDETFLNLFLAELVSHIAEKAHASVPTIDFEQILTGVKECFVEDQSYSLPPSTQKLYKSIYKELIQRFGSKYVLMDMMAKADRSFVELVAITLKSHLKKPTEETQKPKKMWRIFRRKKKVHPVCENKATESHSKKNHMNGSMPSHQQNRKSSCITRAFFTMFNCLKKAFTCCTTN